MSLYITYIRHINRLIFIYTNSDKLYDQVMNHMIKSTRLIHFMLSNYPIIPPLGWSIDIDHRKYRIGKYQNQWQLIYVV
jgi:hypothetical protein